MVFDPQGGGWNQGSLSLCECVESMTRCDGKSPYLYFDEEKNAMIACPSRPARIALEKIQALHKSSGIPERYRHRYIPSIENSRNHLSLNIALSGAVDIIRDFGKNRIRGLYLHGDTGSGKTLISCIILNELIRIYQIPVRYAKITRDILSKLRATFNPNSETFGEGNRIETALANVQVLVIDDFGVHRESEWVSGVLYDLIDARYENNLLTILTSNEKLDSWRDVARGRVYSRLVEMCEEIHIDLPDYRIFSAHKS